MGRIGGLGLRKIAEWDILRESFIEKKKKKSRYDKQERLCAVLAAIIVVITVWIISSAWAWRAERQKQQELAENMLRFHVVADSDSAQDQASKLAVRDALLRYLQDNMPAFADMTTTDPVSEYLTDDFTESGSVESWVREHIEEIEAAAEAALRRSGSSDTVHAAVVTCWFPDRWYAGQLYPAGNYRALRVEIGSAGGKNWWGVLCPGLCFRESVRVVYSDGRRKWLSDALSAEAYSDVTAFSEFKIKWYLWEGTGE